jgi:hypothetical protein
MKLSYTESEDLLERIKGGRDGRGGMWIHMKNLITDEDAYTEDSFGLRYAAVSGGRWSRTDDGWDAMWYAFCSSSNCIKAHAGVWTHSFDDEDGDREDWLVVPNTWILSSYTDPGREDGIDLSSFPGDFRRVVDGAHEHEGDVWDTILVKHTVL